MSPVELDEKGELRIDALQEEGLEFIQGWMMQGLRGQDPYLPEPPDSLASPGRVFEAICEKTDQESRLHENVRKAATNLLRDALEEEAPDPDYLENLLDLVGRVKPPEALGVLQGIVFSPRLTGRYGEDGLDIDLVHALAGLGRLIPVADWKRLLEDPRYATGAFEGIVAWGPRAAVEHLPAFIKAHLRAPEEISLDFPIFSLFDRFGQDQMVRLIDEIWARERVGEEIRDKLDEILTRFALASFPVDLGRGPSRSSETVITGIVRREMSKLRREVDSKARELQSLRAQLRRHEQALALLSRHARQGKAPARRINWDGALKRIPVEFTIADLSASRYARGRSRTYIHQIVKRWKKKGQIRSVGKGKYQKT